MPLGPGSAQPGAQDASYRLPTGARGVLQQAMVLIAARPFSEQAPVPLADPGQGGQITKVQVPATIQFKVSGQMLPKWELFEFPTAYVINYDVIRGNPEFGMNRLALSIDVDTAAKGVNWRVYGMADPLLLDDTTCGPIAHLYRQAADEQIRDYLVAFANEVGGNKREAKLAYEKLASSPNADLARFARRGVRLLTYEDRPFNPTGNFNEHYRWGLFLQQAGLFGPAFGEFDECRTIYRNHGDSQFRGGEMLDRMMAGPFSVFDYMERCGAAAFETNPSYWTCLIVILGERGGTKLSDVEAFEFKANWLLMQYMVWAATRGQLAPLATVHEIENESVSDWAVYPGERLGPPRDIVAERGWFDGVFFVRPRPEGEQSTATPTIGGDEGPNGSAMSWLFADAKWQELLSAFYAQFAWAAAVGEIGPGWPAAGELLDAGHQPVTDEGYAIRAALRYQFSPTMIRRVQMADMPGPMEQYVRRWKVEGPLSAGAASSADGAPLPTRWPAGPAEKSIVMEAEARFVDLRRQLRVESGLARATCWVYCPADQDVRLWLGQNDGAAVWVNGRCIHEGAYYASGQYEDRNLVDTVAMYAPLRAGWNELSVLIEGLAAPKNRGWGFSVRLCDWGGRTIPGLAFLTSPPESFDPAPQDETGRHFTWQAVKDNFTELLPRLDDAALQAMTGIGGLHAEGRVGAAGGMVAISAPDRADSPTYRAPPSTGDEAFRDVVVNNILDWSREAVMVMSYRKNGADRSLLFVKPEGLEAYMQLLKESDDAESMFGGLEPTERLLGYVIVPAGSDEKSSSRLLFVIDCALGPESSWPVDEEDLMAPIPEEFIPNPTDVFPPSVLAELAAEN